MTTTSMLLHADIGALLPRLRRFARVLCPRRDEADDLVQISVERALQRSAQWQPGTRLDSWVFRIMAQAWRGQPRPAARAEPAFSADDTGERGGVAADAPRRALRQAIGRLDDEQRLVLGLVLVEGLPYQEAAAVLDLPPESVGQHLLRARQALQGLLPDQARKMP
ncbi:RNA polymerase sigma factor [Janthinobacterium sp. CG3]|uniref:RNA polymerase sigma factor n=1 Tax=Janthinobacterium sp. CG3 TaxID=1075768 RepID=UPI0012F98BC1|nr:RNA polymerase sigma factor [Janthinobacterium sp. CG3]